MSFAAALAALPDTELESLLTRRPDLMDGGWGSGPGSFEELADQAGKAHSQLAAMGELDGFERDILSFANLVGASGTIDDVVRVSAGLATADDVVTGLDRLRAVALVWFDGEGRWHLPGQIRSQILHPFGLGRPLARLARDLRKHEVVEMAERLGVEPSGELSQSTGAHQGYKKEAYVDAVAAALADLDHLRDVAEQADLADVVQSFLEYIAPETPVIDVDYDAGYLARRAGSRHVYSPVRRDASEVWLEDHGLIVRVAATTAEIPRELGVAARGGRPVDELRRNPPPPEAADRPGPEAVDATAAAAARRLLELTGGLLGALTDEPVVANKSGGIGVRPLGALAKRLGCEARTAAQLVELADAAHLVEERFGRTAPELDIAARGREWLSAPPVEQWLALVDAWLGSPVMVMAAGGRNADGKPIAPLRVGRAPAGLTRRRRDLLGALSLLDPGAVADLDSLFRFLDFTAAGHWAGVDPDLTGEPNPDAADDPVVTLLHAQLAETELLGVTALGGLASPWRHLVDDDWDAARTAAAALLPEVVDQLLVQADLSIVAPGPISAALAAEVDAMADAESRGGATTWRLSEQSLRVALDRGRSAQELLAVLDDHVVGEVPQPVRYLVEDVARRHGRLRVRAVTCLVRCDDTALLAEVVGHGKLRRHLALVAPTVATADVTAPKLLALLRSSGFLPMLEDAEGEIVDPGARETDGPTGPRRRHLESVDADDDGRPWWRLPPRRDPVRRLDVRPAPRDVVARLRSVAHRSTSVGSSSAPRPTGPAWIDDPSDTAWDEDDGWSAADGIPPEPRPGRPLDLAATLRALIQARAEDAVVEILMVDGRWALGRVADLSPVAVELDCVDCGQEHRLELHRVEAVTIDEDAG